MKTVLWWGQDRIIKLMQLDKSKLRLLIGYRLTSFRYQNGKTFSNLTTGIRLTTFQSPLPWQQCTLNCCPVFTVFPVDIKQTVIWYHDESVLAGRLLRCSKRVTDTGPVLAAHPRISVLNLWACIPWETSSCDIWSAFWIALGHYLLVTSAQSVRTQYSSTMYSFNMSVDCVHF